MVTTGDSELVLFKAIKYQSDHEPVNLVISSLKQQTPSNVI